MGTELMPRQTVVALAMANRQIEEDAAKGFAALEDAQKRLQVAFGEYTNVVPGDRGHGAFDPKYPHSREALHKHFKKRAWKYVVQETRIMEFCSQAEKTRIQKQIESDALPEFTADTVMETLAGLVARTPQMLDEAIAEVFKDLTPQLVTQRWRPTYATNEKSGAKIGRKVIVSWLFHAYTFSGKSEWPTLTDHGRTFLKSLHNAVSLLDGQGVVRHPLDAATKADAACRSHELLFETAYFTAKIFRNANCHITFTRMDILERLNKHAGNATDLPKQQQETKDNGATTKC